MQWSVILSKFFGGNRGAALQLLSGIVGLIGIAYGFHTLMVERAQIPVCSAELLTAVGEQSFLTKQQLTVEVAGAVVEPGVWQLAVGARVAEAIDQAGGFSQRADRTFAANGLNLAAPLEDGQKIYVPFAQESSADQVGQSTQNQDSSTAAQNNTAANVISVNSASSDELDGLPGIGQARAASIIENRPYTTLNELVSKGALTQGLFNDLAGLIAL
jgi:competence protein ComEA